MLFLAVNFGLAMAGGGQQQAALLDPTWAKVKAHVLRIENLGQAPGLGVLIDGRGYFLAHRTAVTAQPIIGKLNETESLILTLVAVDDQTQLALLRADNWIGNGREGVAVATKTAPNTQLIIATGSGPMRGDFVSDQKVGQMRPSLRYAPLSEIRLESGYAPVGGAIAFDRSGALVGLLGATLSANADRSFTLPSAASKSTALTENVKAAGGKGGGGQYAPQGMTVAYSLGASVLKRVVDGFLSDDHKVKHPSTGLFFKGSSEPGALIEEVLPGSPAATAGILVGDLIIEANGQAIETPVDLAIQLFRQNVGDTMSVRLKRGGEEKTVSVKVGSQTESD